MRGGTARHNTTRYKEAMTRFELVIKGFADPWLRPLTHIAGCIKKHPGYSEEKMHTHTDKVPT
jgi:hypothetical protein